MTSGWLASVSLKSKRRQTNSPGDRRKQMGLTRDIEILDKTSPNRTSKEKKKENDDEHRSIVASNCSSMECFFRSSLSLHSRLLHPYLSNCLLNNRSFYIITLIFRLELQWTDVPSLAPLLHQRKEIIFHGLHRISSRLDRQDTILFKSGKGKTQFVLGMDEAIVYRRGRQTTSRWSQLCDLFHADKRKVSFAIPIH